MLDKEAISQDNNTFKAKVSEGNVGFFTEYRLTGAFAGSTVHDTHVLWIPDKEETLMSEALPVARNRVFVSCTNEYVPQTMRWLDAQLEDEMLWSLYLGEQGAEKGGWNYNEQGKIVPTASAETMNYLGVNGFLFAPIEYFMEHYDTQGAVADKYASCLAYADAGLVQTYSNTYLGEVKFNKEEADKLNRIQTDIDTAVKEYMASAIINGVTDDSWKEFQKILEDIGINEVLKLYQDGINNKDI